MKRKILHGLLAAVLAFGIWVYVVTVVSPESENTYYNIPVVLSNESVLLEKGLMVASDTEPTVTLRLRGNRSDLNKLKNSDITAIADLSKINDPGEQSLSVHVTFAGNDFEILEQTPRMVTLQIAQWSTKEVPVVVDYTGTLGRDYIAYKDEAILDRESITITGPKTVVDQITQAKITVDLTDQVATLIQTCRYTLCDADGQPVDAATIKTNAAEVTLTLKIQQVKEIQLLVNVTYGGGANESNTQIVLDPQTIKVSGSENLLQGFDSLVVGTINLTELTEETLLTFPINLKEGLENLSGITQVNVMVSFPGLATKVMEVSNVRLDGLKEGLSADIATKVLTITLRGPKDVILNITAENITVLLDVSQAELGDNLIKAKIMVDSEYSGVGAIGSYNVLVSLTENSASGEE